MPPVNKPVSRKIRKRLAPPWVVLTVGGGILILMFSIFPDSSWFRRLAGGEGKEEADSLKVLLLSNLIQKGQGSAELRKDYALQLGLTGNYGQALAEMDTLLAQSEQESQIPLRKLEYLLAQRALASKGTEALTALARGHIISVLESFLRLETVPSQDLRWVAESAITAGRPDLAYGLYLRLAAQDKGGDAGWNLLAARSAFSAKDYEGAGKQYALAVLNRPLTEDGKAVLIEGLNALQAAERLDLALALGDRCLSGLAYDPKVLAYLVRLARAANKIQTAEKYADMLVRTETLAGIEP